MMTKHAPADWSADSPELKRERAGYWYTGFGTGPDTTMGVLWLSAILLVLCEDATCHPFEGLSSGADDQKCSTTSFWNASFWNASGGDACLKPRLLGGEYNAHDPSLPGCMDAFTAYRAMPEYTGGEAFTCNCSGGSSSHAYLGLGGPRPSTIGNTAIYIGQICIALLSPLVGHFADHSDKRLKVWWYLCILGALFNLGMMVVGEGGIWLIGIVCSIFTMIFTEIQIPIRASYMEDVAFDDATRGFLGGMRQFASYFAQLIYALVVGGGQILGLFPNATVEAIVAAGLCGVWFGTVMPLVLRMMRDHPAKREKQPGSMCVQTFSELCAQFANLKKYPEALKYLLAHVLLQNGGPGVIISLIPSYGFAVLERSSFYMTIIALAVLVCGTPGAYCFAKISQKGTCSFKLLWIIIFVLNIAIDVLVPLLANSASFMSYVFAVLVAGVIGAFALSWFYSLGWPAFITLVPPGQAAAYMGIFTFCNMIVQPFGPIVYNAIVQATDNHVLAWLMFTPWSVVGMLIMMTVNFDKGKADAGHPPTDAKPTSAAQA